MKLNLDNIFESMDAWKKVKRVHPTNDEEQAGKKVADRMIESKYEDYIEKNCNNGQPIDFRWMERLFEDGQPGTDSRYVFWEFLRNILSNRKIITNNFSLTENEMKLGKCETYLANNPAFNNDSEHLKIIGWAEMKMELCNLKNTSFRLSIQIPAGDIYMFNNTDKYLQPAEFELRMKLNNGRFTAYNMFQIITFIRNIYNFIFSTGFYTAIEMLQTASNADLQTEYPDRQSFRWKIYNSYLFIETGIIILINYYLMNNLQNLDIVLCNSELFPDFNKKANSYPEYLDNNLIDKNNELLWQQIIDEEPDILNLIFKDESGCNIRDFFNQFFIDNKCLPFNLNDKIGNARDPRRTIRLGKTLDKFCYPTIDL